MDKGTYVSPSSDTVRHDGLPCHKSFSLLFTICTKQCINSAVLVHQFTRKKKLIRKKGTWAPIIISSMHAHVAGQSVHGDIARPSSSCVQSLQANRQGQGGHRFACPNRRNWKKGGPTGLETRKTRSSYPSAPRLTSLAGAASSAFPRAPAALATEFGAPCISCVPLPHRVGAGRETCPDPASRAVARRRRRRCDQRQASKQSCSSAGRSAVDWPAAAYYYYVSTPRRSLRTNDRQPIASSRLRLVPNSGCRSRKGPHRTVRITCSFHCSFGFMTPGPAPRRPVRVASRRASRSDAAGQSKLCTYRTGQVRQSTRRAPVAQVRQGGGGRHPGARPGSGEPHGHVTGRRPEAARQGTDGRTNERGTPSGTSARATAKGQHDGLGCSCSAVVTVLRCTRGPMARARAASALCSIGRWGWGPVLRSDKDVTRSRAGRARRNPSFPARPSPFQRARLEFLWRRQLVFFFLSCRSLVEFAAAVAHSHSKDEASPEESRTESQSNEIIAAYCSDKRSSELTNR